MKLSAHKFFAEKHRHLNVLRTLPFAIALGMAWLCTVSPVFAQPPTDAELLADRAFDLVVLKASQGGKSQRVLPLSFDNREVPSPFPGGWLRVRLVDRPGSDLEVAWGDIARIDLFEQMLLNRGVTLTEEKNFDRAFDFFARLHNEHPQTAGLAAATERYLLAEANAAYREKDYDKTIALLLSLNDRYPNSPTLGRAVDAVAGKLIEQRVGARDFRGARSQLNIVEQQFGNLKLTTVDTWRERFRRAADAKAAEGAQLLAAGDYRKAQTAAEQAFTVLPTHEPSRRLLVQIEQRYPRVRVGVTTASLPPEQGAERVRLDAPTRLRTSPLVAPTITRLVGYTGEGGRYTSPLGQVQLDDTGRYLEVFARGDQTPFTLARWIARATTRGGEDYRPGLADVVASIRVDPPESVVMTLNRSHFRPEALFKEAPLVEAGFGSMRSAKLIERSAERLLAEASDKSSATPSVTIEEIVFSDDRAAIAALAQGSVDLVADVPPWQLKKLRENRDITVERYLLPTVHGLIPTKTLPLLDEREFRRGLLYGIDREQILNVVLLSNQAEQGFRVVSGPFPFGYSLADPVRYGYNDAVAPRPSDPRLSAILTAVAWNRVQQEEADDDEAPTDAPLPPLRLAHAADPFARLACQTIQIRLQQLGFDIELVELSEAELLADEPDFDLRYAELTIAEPVVDAHTLLGPGGLTGRCSDPMQAALRRLLDAQNTKEVQFALFEVHRLANSDLPFLPLWQTTKYLAYRKELTGVPETPAALYQDVTNWRKELSTASRSR